MELSRQVRASGIDAEIIVVDDGSSEPSRAINRPIAQLPGVIYRELPANVGRAAVRNLLATRAKHRYLLFLDADGKPNPDLVANYAAALPASLIVGGRTYSDHPPVDTDRMLHWSYGRKRETPDREQRERMGLFGLQTNNFLIDRDLYLAHPIPELSEGYGHEDTLWGYLLDKAGVNVRHIDNPVEHLGLEASSVFLRKQREAVANLVRLRAKYPELRTRLTDFADRHPIKTRWAGRFPERVMLSTLNRPAAPLWILDLVKLHWYDRFSRAATPTPGLTP